MSGAGLIHRDDCACETCKEYAEAMTRLTRPLDAYDRALRRCATAHLVRVRRRGDRGYPCRECYDIEAPRSPDERGPR